MITAHIGLGANLGDAEATLRRAVNALRALPHSHLTALSSLYRSTPLGPSGQDDYLNAVARLETNVAPHALLQALQDIESRHGRLRLERWGPRTLDLDLLLYGNDRITTPSLTIPHPEMPRRNFVVVPLLEVSPAACLPDGVPLANLDIAADRQGLAILRPGPAWGD